MEDCFNKLPNGRNAGAGFSHDRKLAGVSTHKAVAISQRAKLSPL
jgi:hypothetical protein